MSGRRAPMMLREIFPRRLGVSSPGSPILVVVLTMIVCAGTAGAAFAGDESVASNYTMAVWASEKGMPGDVFTLAQDLDATCGSEGRLAFFVSMATISLHGNPPTRRLGFRAGRSTRSSGLMTAASGWVLGAAAESSGSIEVRWFVTRRPKAPRPGWRR